MSSDGWLRTSKTPHLFLRIQELFPVAKAGRENRQPPQQESCRNRTHLATNWAAYSMRFRPKISMERIFDLSYESITMATTREETVLDEGQGLHIEE